MKSTLIFLIILLIVSCTKKQTITVHVIDPTDNSPIEIFEYYIQSTRVSRGDTLKETEFYGKTDFQGNGIATLKLKKGRSYKLIGINPGGYCYMNTKSFDLTYSNKNSSYQFELYKCATLKMKIENIGCTGENDKMIYRVKPSYGGWSNWSNDYMGCYAEVYSTNYSYPVGPLKVHWKVEKTGFTYEDSVTVNLNIYSPTSFHLQY